MLRALVALLVLLSANLLACGRETETAARPTSPPPVAAPPALPTLPMPSARVSSIELGTAVSADRRVTAPTSSFASSDTIYASVLTEGQAAGSTLSARWTYEDGQVVSQNSETLGSPGAVNTEFHISKPEGWPAGRYRLEIALNGQPAGARDFEVR
jgi:hypothetical protein